MKYTGEINFHPYSDLKQSQIQIAELFKIIRS